MEILEKTFYENRFFPLLNSFSKKWKIIRDEYFELNAPVMNIHRINKSTEEVFKEVENYISKGNQYGWIQGWGNNDNLNKGNLNWIQYGLIVDGFKVPFVGKEMQQTINLLLKIEGIKVAALLKLEPFTVLHTHSHPDIKERNVLQMHLPICTAEKGNFNYLNIEGEFRQYQQGVPIIFDGSFRHFALNESNYSRTTLYLEFDKESLINPLL